MPCGWEGNRRRDVALATIIIIIIIFIAFVRS